MEFNRHKSLSKKIKFLKAKKRINTKNVIIIILTVCIILILLKIISAIFSKVNYFIKNRGTNKTTTITDNNSKKDLDESKKETTKKKKPNEKNDDEYYMDLVDKYYDDIEIASINNVLDSYNHLGVVVCNGYINFRSEPNEKNTRSIIGLMNNGDALDIINWDVKENSIFCKVKSGGMTGYVAKQFIKTGDEAIQMAKADVCERAIILVDKLRMRSEPNTTNDNVVGTTYKGERYKIDSIENGWAKVYADNIDDIEFAYINADKKYIEVKYCLSEARTQDLKSDVLTYYDNIGFANVRDYINVRKTAKDNGTIVGKLPRHAGCEILGETGKFYKIKSGKVVGYVSKQYLTTGKKAEELALQYADLRAIIKIPALKVRSGPSIKSKQWTTIRREETYIVTNQLDGWVEIEIDEGTDKGYISTQNNYVEVRYALDQAIEFHPVSTTKVSSTRDKIKNTALKYVGGNYVWGGNNLATGVDCSGFVQQIYKLFGVSMNRVAREQAKQGVEVSSANKKVGDLIFYANSSGVIDHVAIYIGNNQIVHAATTKTGIKISNWNYRTPKCIRNVLGKK